MSLFRLTGWDSHLCLNFFSKLPSVKKYRHFTRKPDGSVTCKEQVDSQPVTYHLKQPNKEVSAVYPGIQQPTGLSHDRQLYLFREIREFVDEKCKDLVCPKPHEKETTESAATVAEAPEEAAEAMEFQNLDTEDHPTNKGKRGRPRKAPSGSTGRPRKQARQ